MPSIPSLSRCLSISYLSPCHLFLVYSGAILYHITVPSIPSLSRYILLLHLSLCHLFLVYPGAIYLTSISVPSFPSLSQCHSNLNLSRCHLFLVYPGVDLNYLWDLAIYSYPFLSGPSICISIPVPYYPSLSHPQPSSTILSHGVVPSSLSCHPFPIAFPSIN